MIYLVHGDNIVKSRAQIVNQQKKLNTQNKVERSLDEITLSELSIHVKSTSLFGDVSFVVLDVTGTKGSSEHIEILKGKSKETVVILYAEKTLPKTNVFVKSIETLGAKVIENKLEHNENIFKFVDTLFSRNRVNAYKEYERLIKAETDPFYIFTMILYGLRNIAKGHFNSPSFEKGSPYTKTKVKGQLRSFDEKRIRYLYDKFYSLEKDLKLGEILPDVAVSMAIENVLNSN